MSASKKDQLLKNLTRRDAQKPPMEVTYENKGIVLEQMMDRQPRDTIDIANNNDSNINSDNMDIDIEGVDDINNDSDSENDINVASNNDINNDSNSDIKSEIAAARESDAIDAILSANQKPSSSKSFKGFYLDPDVARVLEKLAKRHGKGIQSQMVNEALRMVFISKGLM